MDDNERDMFNENENINENNELTDNKYNSNENLNNGYNDINFVMPSLEEPKKKKSHKKKFFGYVAVALVAALIGGLSGGYLLQAELKLTIIHRLL